MGSFNAIHDARLDDIAREFHVFEKQRVRWSIRPLDPFEEKHLKWDMSQMILLMLLVR